jgi:hypothetical protein
MLLTQIWPVPVNLKRYADLNHSNERIKQRYMKYDGSERRRFIRVNTLLHVLIRIHSGRWDDITCRVNGTVLNLSKDGLFIQTDATLSEGGRLSFPIYSKREKQQYLIRGIISQVRDNGIVVMITEIDPPDIVINDFLADDLDRLSHV